MTLPVSRLVNVSVNLSPLAAQTRSFGILMVAGDSNVINGNERFRTYDNLTGVVSDFGTSAPEYQAAALYFGQSPAPQTIMIGRWFRTAAPALNQGGILNSTQQLISTWQAITSGGFDITIDATAKTLTGLDFSGAANLNAVATIITAALSSATCVFNGSQFLVSSNTTGDGSQATGTITLNGNVSYGVQAANTIVLTGQPSPGDSVTVDGTAVTFVASSPSGNEVLIGGSTDLTAAALLTFLQNSADVNIAKSTYNLIADTVHATARVYGTAGNAYTMAKSGSNISVGGANFSGGVNPDTLTIDGTAFTFVPSSPSGNQILVGATQQDTAENINTVLTLSSDTNVLLSTYNVSGSVVTVTYKTVGTGGNAFTLAKSAANISLSASTLTGGAVASFVGFATSPGSGTDISTMLKLTSSTSIGLVPGYGVEDPVDCAGVLANLSSAWYGLTFAASVFPTNDQSLAVSTFIEAQDVKRIYGDTITDTSVLSSQVTTDLASLQSDAGYLRSFCQYSENAYAIASFIGRAFSVNFLANRSTITLMYKQEPSVTPENLSTTQANTLLAKRCNVFTSYVNNTSIIQYGVMSGPAYFDEIHGLDWFEDAVQTACYNLMYTSPTKIPQTDSGVNQFVNAIAGVCDQAVNNGLVAPGIWNGPSYGQVVTGQYLKSGYYIYAQPIALQSQSDREARQAPPIIVLLKLAGAIQQVNVIVNVNR